VIKEILKYYNEKLKKKHIILFIISMIIFVIFFKVFLNDNTYSYLFGTKSLLYIMQEKVILLFLVLFSSIVAYFYLPVISVLMGYVLASDLVTYNLFGSSIITTKVMIGIIIQLFVFTLCGALGMNVCYHTTERAKQRASNSLKFIDIKKMFAEIRKDENKIKEIEHEKEKLKNKVYDTKIDMKKVALIFVISSVIEIIAILITYIN